MGYYNDQGRWVLDAIDEASGYGTAGTSGYGTAGTSGYETSYCHNKIENFEYDTKDDCFVIFGIRYSIDMFRSFAFKEMIGKKFEIVDNDGVLTVKFDE